MPSNFIAELQWRGMIHDIMPGTEEALLKKVSAGYIGFDPTADSLHVGHLVQIMTLVHFQRAGHKPYALVGGATGMVGDPSGKSQERNLLDADTLNHNVACVRQQLEAFLDFNSGETAAEMVNNYDWFQNMSFLDFIRDVGKHISVNYMMAKDSVKKRLETGMSFTEFSYQLVQGYDFYHLNKHHNCILQLGGSDQWGNIVTGTELIRRKSGGEAYAVTTPLIKKADGTKFGKTESGTVWLDPELTSPYAFYQFWINADDRDVQTLLRTFTFRTQQELAELELATTEKPQAREAQRALAHDVTTLVHGDHATSQAKAAAAALFGQGELRELDATTLDSAMREAPNAAVSLNDNAPTVSELLVACELVASNGAGRRAIAEGGVSVNNVKVTDENATVSIDDFLHGKWLVLRRGKRTFGGISLTK